jgi:hypothetical protein
MEKEEKIRHLLYSLWQQLADSKQHQNFRMDKEENSIIHFPSEENMLKAYMNNLFLGIKSFVQRSKE